MPSPLSLLLRALGAAALMLAFGAGVAQAVGPFPITEGFRNSTTQPSWRITGSASLTAPTDGEGNGWLRLTPTTGNAFGVARNEDAFPSNNGILSEFEYATWGGSGADGLTFFLYDGATSEANFRVGAAGGSLGYSSCNATPGLRNAYIGVGFDEFGNFANSALCSNTVGGFGAGGQPNRVSVRGSEADGYPYLTSAATSQSLSAVRGSARKVKVSITPDLKLSVYITYPDGQIQTVTRDYQLPPGAPSTLKLGFAASTGGSTNNHEIRNTQVVKPTNLATTVTDAAAGAPRGDRRTWTSVVTNNGPNPTANTTVKATSSTSTLANVTWTCTAGTGGTCQAASGTGMPDTKADLAVNGSVTYSISADPAPGTSDARLQVTANTGVGEDTGELDPTDNVAIDSTDLTPVDDVLPTASLSSAGLLSRTSLGTWRGGNLVYTSNWQRCAPDGTSCVDIAGATGATYTVGVADKGSSLRLRQRATNAAGAVDAYSTLITAPDTAIVSGPPAATTATSATHGFSTTGAAGTVYECSLDGGAFAACLNPDLRSGLADGDHVLAVRAVRGGLADPTPAVSRWRVDTSTSVSVTGPTPGRTTTKRPTITGMGEPGSTVSISVDGQTLVTGTVAVDGTFSIPLPADLADGAHSIVVDVVDALGNRAQATTSTEVVTAPPAMPAIAAKPALRSGNPTSTFALVATPGTTLRCRIDGGAWVPCDATATFAGLPDGAHTLSVSSVDDVGNESPNTDYTWTVDTKAPAAPTQTAGPEKLTRSRGVRFDISVEAGSTLECSLDGASFAPCVAPLTFDGLETGRHVLLTRQVDEAGNVGPVSRHEWVVDPDATTAEPGPARAVTVAVPTALTARDNRRVDVGCSLDRSSVRWCAAKLYARDSQGRKVLVGTGRVSLRTTGKRSAVVPVRLNALGRRILGRALGGLAVSVELSTRGRGATTRTLRASRRTTLYPQRVTAIPMVNPFLFDSTRTLRADTTRALRRIAAQVRSAKTIACVGFTDSLGTSRYNVALGKRRAALICSLLKRYGVRGKVVVRSGGENEPRQSNRTAAGRLSNRRVELRVGY